MLTIFALIGLAVVLYTVHWLSFAAGHTTGRREGYHSGYESGVEVGKNMAKNTIDQ